jgi:S-adenosylmethionine hydrolase
MPGPIITLLTDFGTRDHYVASMKGAILAINPAANIVDISHDIAPFQILEAAYTLSQAWHNFPAGTIHVAVVDPGVGSSRRPIVVHAGGHFFIGPDNGIFSLVLDRLGEYAAHEITNTRYMASNPSRTFHGRDIFTPVAAHISTSVVISRFGASIEDLTFIKSVHPLEIAPLKWEGIVLHVDRYGTFITNLPSDKFPVNSDKSYCLAVGGVSVSQYFHYYDAAAPGVPFLIHGSSGYLEVSMNQGDAAAFLGVRPGQPFEIRRM